MKKILIFCLLLPLLSCGGKAVDSNETVAKTETQAVPQQVAATASTTTRANLTLSAPQQTVNAGEAICLDITVADFRNLISMQYSMKWEPAVLQFQGVKGFKLPHLGAQNFGAHRATEGILTAVWIDNSLNGVTLADGSPIFQVCFNVTGQSGQASTFTFESEPTPFEVVTVKEEVISINGVEGLIKVN